MSAGAVEEAKADEGSAPRRAPRVAYFVHDINDPAVARRVTMLRAAGLEVSLAGFRRDSRVPETVEGARVTDLGQTHDGALGQRARMVLAHVAKPRTIVAAAAGADVVIGRNLEALALAARGRGGARLVYECLDIHRSLLGRSLPARAIQAAEAWLLRRVDLLIVSSPAFLREYFSRRPTLTALALLVENKLLVLGGEQPPAVAAPAAPPWTIGWFGNLRCRRTFEVLLQLTQALDGRLAVLIAGRPSSAVFDDLPAAVAKQPHMRYAGPYRPEDLPGLYGQCHFAWGIDYFEEGLNSRWLLPNKLYEAASFGVVPIALEDVETGRWLAERGAGLLLGEGDPVEPLTEVFRSLDDAAYRRLRGAVEAIPRRDLVADEEDCAALARAVCGG